MVTKSNPTLVPLSPFGDGNVWAATKSKCAALVQNASKVPEVRGLDDTPIMDTSANTQQ